MKRVPFDWFARKFGRYTVLSVTSTKSPAIGVVRCDCGTQKTVHLKHLKSGASRSCGCLSVELTKMRERTGITPPPPEYHSWSGMLDRCRNTNNGAYRYYGGRGITVCDRWRLFKNFIADMGPRPSPGHSIDRINTNGNYEPGNCRWATRDVQLANRRPPQRARFGSRLCIAKAKDVHRLLDAGHRNLDIAAMFNMAPCTISNIKRGVLWKRSTLPDVCGCPQCRPALVLAVAEATK